MSELNGSPPRVEPRRSKRVDAAIETAVRTLVIKSGYGALTMENVSRLSGVSKATIYRRWATKAEMVADLLGNQELNTIKHPDTGSLADDLFAWLCSVADALAEARGAMVMSLISEFLHDPDLAAAFRERFIPRDKARFDAMLERGTARGELRPGTDYRLIADMLVGALYHRMIIFGEAIGDELIRTYVDSFLYGAGMDRAASPMEARRP